MRGLAPVGVGFVARSRALGSGSGIFYGGCEILLRRRDVGQRTASHNNEDSITASRRRSNFFSCLCAPSVQPTMQETCLTLNGITTDCFLVLSLFLSPRVSSQCVPPPLLSASLNDIYLEQQINSRSTHSRSTHKHGHGVSLGFRQRCVVCVCSGRQW